jgi:hypothetical protein
LHPGRHAADVGIGMAQPFALQRFRKNGVYTSQKVIRRAKKHRDWLT